MEAVDGNLHPTQQYNALSRTESTLNYSRYQIKVHLNFSCQILELKKKIQMYLDDVTV